MRRAWAKLTAEGTPGGDLEAATNDCARVRIGSGHIIGERHSERSMR
jgi:hypothetical protein